MGDNHRHKSKQEKLELAMQARNDADFAENQRDGKEITETLHQSSENIVTDTWQEFTLADAYQDRPPLQYIAGKLFSLPSLNIIYGAPGSLKSFIMADLAICVAAGEPWLPAAPWMTGDKCEPIPTTQAPVMWLDFDNGVRRTHDRIKALAKARGLPVSAPISYYSMPYPWLDANDPLSIDQLINRVNIKGAKLVVIDNLGTISGGADENSSSMVTVMSNLRRLAEATGACIDLIHHQRKSSTNGNQTRAGDSLRGHSSIEAAIDLAIWVQRAEGDDSIKMQSTKTRGIDVHPFGAQFTYDNNSLDELETARFFGITITDTTSNKAVEAAIHDTLASDAPLNETQLIAKVQEVMPGIGRDRIKRVVKSSAADKKIKCSTGAHNANVYSL